MVSINDHCVDLIAIPSNSTYFQICISLLLLFNNWKTLLKFQLLYSVNIWVINMEKLIALFYVFGDQVWRFCKALGQHPHLNTTCGGKQQASKPVIVGVVSWISTGEDFFQLKLSQIHQCQCLHKMSDFCCLGKPRLQVQFSKCVEVDPNCH